MNVCVNEIAYESATEGSLKETNGDGCLTFSKNASRIKQDISALWKIAPVYGWYACKRPDAALIKENSRCIQMVLARLHSGHLRVEFYLLRIEVSPP